LHDKFLFFFFLFSFFFAAVSRLRFRFTLVYFVLARHDTLYFAAVTLAVVEMMRDDAVFCFIFLANFICSQ